MILMQKKCFALLLALSLALALTACGGGAQPSASSAPAPSAAPSATGGGSQTGSDSQGPDRYVFLANGNTVAVNDNMADVLAELGEPLSYFEAESCAFKGLDKTYTYAGFSITTRPDGEQDFINSILLTDDSVTTPEGLYLGSSADDVLTAYGSDGEDLGTLIAYTKGDCVLNFVLNEGKVVSIEYLPAA